MRERLNTDITELRELRCKNIILVMGATGSGKSTLANGIISGSDALEEDDDENIVTTKPLY